MSQQNSLPIKFIPPTPPENVRQHSTEIVTLEDKIIIKNPNVRNKINPMLSSLGNNASDFTGVLVLSDISTFQQLSIKEQREIKYSIREKRIENRGKLFRMKTQPPFFCNSTKSLIAKVKNGKIKEARFSKIPCRSWSCPVCSIRKAKSLRILLTKIAQLNNLTYFITLTLDSRKLTTEEKSDTHAYITKKFNHFKTILNRKKFNYYDPRIKRYFTFDLSKREIFKYLWVIEFQKNGNAHLHVLCNQFLPVIILRKVWEQVGGGHRIDIQNVRSVERVSNYISSYLVKGIKDSDLQANKGYGFKYGQRRYSISRSCRKPERNVIKAFEKASFDVRKKILKLQGLDWIITELENDNDDILEVIFDS